MQCAWRQRGYVAHDNLRWEREKIKEDGLPNPLENRMLSHHKKDMIIEFRTSEKGALEKGYLHNIVEN